MKWTSWQILFFVTDGWFVAVLGVVTCLPSFPGLGSGN